LTSTTVIYHNNGDNTFTKLDSISLPNVSGPSCWGDYDNDGDLDIVLIGYSSGSYISKIYRNDGNNSFTEMTSEDLIGVHRGSIALGDYDNDGDLDIILTGDTGISTIGSISKIYRNNIQIPNTLPTVPANLTSTIIGYDVILNWSKSTDLQTLQPGLGYNLVIGTSPGAVDVLSPMSDRNTGYRRISNLGNTNNRNSWLMKSLIRGQTYYWSVQALDNCFAGSAFAQEKSFTIPSIEIISPIGGENWMVGTVQKIKWTSSGVDYIRIKYSTDNGTSWGNITNQTQSGYGSLNWTVLNTPSSNCKVKITAVSDSIVNSISENVFTIFTYPSPLALNYNYSFGDATKMSSYQIIGLPGANDLPFANLMTGSPGKENDWRAFWDIGSGDYLEYNGSDIFNITPGKAFWVISKNLISINQTVNAVPLSADNSYSIDVHSEWNLISNPFNKSIAWSSIQIANNVTQSIHFYQTGSYTNSANFEPYKGYYFYNANGLDSLKIPYLTTNPLPKNNSVSIKELEIMLRDNAVQKAMISIGVSEDAKQGLDLLDIFSPPSQFCEISMSLFNNELETNYKYLQNDYRPGITDGQEYNIVIKNTSDETLKLVTNGEENFSEYEIYLLDKRLMKLYNLRDQNKITIKKNTPGKEYSLFIGTEEYILQKKSRLLPIEYLLYQNYPNPFNPNTTILFALPQQSNVSLKIFNILGELMVELVNDQLYEEGYHEIMFDGSLLSSGVYIYRIQAGEFSDIKKMLLLK
ncbi:MAG: FG-GAP-like repeat-containing protein, partial [Ignavibacteria bacterium]|nr:FG-GAP-like repeat-containing protein [Ignavibacteria bacterium]